jgi:hypothetical protein
MKQSLAEQIASTRRRLAAARPRSNQRIELELRLRDLMTKQLRREIRKDRAA